MEPAVRFARDFASCSAPTDLRARTNRLDRGQVRKKKIDGSRIACLDVIDVDAQNARLGTPKQLRNFRIRLAFQSWLGSLRR